MSSLNQKWTTGINQHSIKIENNYNSLTHSILFLPVLLLFSTRIFESPLAEKSKGSTRKKHGLDQWYSIKNKLSKKSFCYFLNFFVFCITPQLYYSEQGQNTGGWHKEYVLRKAHLRETPQEIMNHYIKEEDAWRHFLAEINNYYIEKEITWIGTLT